MLSKVEMVITLKRKSTVTQPKSKHAFYLQNSPWLSQVIINLSIGLWTSRCFQATWKTDHQADNRRPAWYASAIKHPAMACGPTKTLTVGLSPGSTAITTHNLLMPVLIDCHRHSHAHGWSSSAEHTVTLNYPNTEQWGKNDNVTSCSTLIDAA